jgi:hypothetical protein
MKDTDRRTLYREFDGEPRTTCYKLELFIDTEDGLEPFDTIHMDNDPLLPSEGDHIDIEWFEDEDGEEISTHIAREDIGSDKPYTKLTSHNLEITDISTTYTKENFIENHEKHSRAVVHKTIILAAP